MKTGQSTSYPLDTELSNGFTQVRYDISPFTKKSMMGEGDTMTGFSYSYIEVSGELTRAKIIDGVISNIYTKDAELALINNEIATPGTQKYADYQALRVHAKEVALSIVP